MNSDDLAMFAAVVNAGSISRAAFEQGADQSTVSRRIANLETEMGARLLHRSGRGVVPTHRGQELLRYAIKVTETLEEATRAMRQGLDNGPAHLRIGAQPTIARILFGSLAQALKKEYPQTRLRLVEGLAYQLLSALDDKEIDIALLYRPEHPGALAYDPLLYERMWLVMPAGDERPADGWEVSRLGELPLIVPSTHHGIRVLLETTAARHGFHPNIVLECDCSISLTKRLVMEGCGNTILPLAAVKEDVEAGRLHAIPLKNPTIERCVALVLGKTPVEPDGLWQTSQIIKRTATDLARTGRWPDAAP
nr:LysR family transcriptional regulator [Pseudomonas sp.]